MSALVPVRPDIRPNLRRAGDALSRTSIGTVPILWNSVDDADRRIGTDGLTILDDVARTGYEGVQLGPGFPGGADLRNAPVERAAALRRAGSARAVGAGSR